MTTPSNAAVIAALRQLVAYTQLEDGQSQSFRTRAYEKAIDAISVRTDVVAELSQSDLTAIEGVGDSTARKIRELADRGTIDKVERLKQKYPASMLELMRIPGLGPKTVLALQEHLDVTDVAGLRAAIEQERLRTLPGLGAKSEQKIAEAIELLGIHSEETRTPIFDAMAVARRLIADLERSDLVDRIEYAGSLRRLEETIGDIDLLVVSDAPAEVMDSFTSLPGISAQLGSGATKASVVIEDRAILAGRAGCADNLTIGEGAVLGGTAVAFKDVPAGAMLWGNPARDKIREMRIQKTLDKLPEMRRRSIVS